MSLHRTMLVIGLIATLMSAKSCGVPLDDSEQQQSLLHQKQDVIAELNQPDQPTQAHVTSEITNTVTDAGVTAVGNSLPHSHPTQTTLGGAVVIMKERETTQSDFVTKSVNDNIGIVDVNKKDASSHIQQSQPSRDELTESTPKQRDDGAKELQSRTEVQDSATKLEGNKTAQQHQNDLKQLKHIVAHQNQAQHPEQREEVKRPENNGANKVLQASQESQQNKESKQDQSSANQKQVRAPEGQKVNPEETKPDEAKATKELQPLNAVKQPTKQEEGKQQMELQKTSEAQQQSKFQGEQKQLVQNLQAQPSQQQPGTIPANISDSKDNHQVTSKEGEKRGTQITGDMRGKENTSDNSTHTTSATLEEKNNTLLLIPSEASVVNATTDEVITADRQNENKNITAGNWLSKLSQAITSAINNVKQLKAQYVDRYITTKLNNSETERRRKVGTDL